MEIIAMIGLAMFMASLAVPFVFSIEQMTRQLLDLLAAPLLDHLLGQVPEQAWGWLTDHPLATFAVTCGVSVIAVGGAILLLLARPHAITVIAALALTFVGAVVAAAGSGVLHGVTTDPAK